MMHTCNGFSLRRKNNTKGEKGEDLYIGGRGSRAESVSRRRKGRREYLKGTQTRQLMKQLDCFFETTVEVPRIRVGKKQTIETLITEEALLLAKFLRSERNIWKPRISELKARDHSGEHNVRV